MLALAAWACGETERSPDELAAVGESSTPRAGDSTTELPHAPPETRPDAPPVVQPPGESKPRRHASSNFDPHHAREAIVRITKVHRLGWAACGFIHSVGVIEIEVLHVGEQPVPMAMYVSCPADFGKSRPFQVGNLLHVEFYARRQWRWPLPPVELPTATPVRFSRQLELLPSNAASTPRTAGGPRP